MTTPHRADHHSLRPAAMRVRVAGLAVALGLCVACGSGGGDDAAPAPKESITALTLPDPVSSDGAKRTKLGTLSASQWGIAGEPDNLVEAFGSIWTKTATGKVLRIDPKDGTILKTIDTGYSDVPGCEGFGVDRTSLWACAGENTLVRIDPDAGTVSDPLEVSRIGDQLRLVTTDEGLWVIEADGKTLSAIDRDGQVATSVDLGAFCTDLAVGVEAVWVICPSDNAVIQVDPAKGTVVKKLGIEAPRVAMVADNRLWVDFAEGLAQIDTSTDKVEAVYGVAPGMEGAIWDDGDVAWVRAAGEDFLTRIDPAEHAVTDVIEAPKLPSGGDVIVADGAVWATAYDDSTLVKLKPPR